MKYRILTSVILLLSITLTSSLSYAQNEDSKQEMSVKALNPTAKIYKMVLMNNLTFGDHDANTLWIEPAIPVYFGDKLQLSNFAMIPVDTRYVNGSHRTSLGNIIYTGNFSLQKPFKLWGGHFTPALGPAITLKTNTYGDYETYMDDTWNVGLTVAGIYKNKGFLALFAYTPTWGVGGNKVNSSTLQYVLNYSFKSGTGINSSPLLSYNEKLGKWIVPFGLGVSQIFKTSSAIYNLAVSGYYNAIRPDVLDDMKWQLQVKFYVMLPM
ncbi:hypothetical protein K4L44_07685 [Halosquirtibacter laminarini]|uniref:Uncharacterized protein n=1 Tax=Halosquirtibacter laminarini TaxID=3374600 RepID=A0AC61NIY3_9BACT|nr:hypothetical protein K4L44_07685 [Prolixibacteraceae bacterium]